MIKESSTYQYYFQLSRKRKKKTKGNTVKSDELPLKKANKVSKYVKKTLYIKLVRDKFLDDLIDTKVALNLISNSGDIGCSLCEISKKPFKRKVIVEKQTSRDLKSLSFNIKKINKRNHIVAIMKKLHKKENKIKIHVNKCGHPKFRVISKSDIKGRFYLFIPHF